MNIPADTLCGVGFCVWPGNHTIRDPASDEYIPVCQWHYTGLRRIWIEFEKYQRAVAHQTLRGV